MVERWKQVLHKHPAILNVDVSKSIMAISVEEGSFEFILLL